MPQGAYHIVLKIKSETVSRLNEKGKVHEFLEQEAFLNKPSGKLKFQVDDADLLKGGYLYLMTDDLATAQALVEQSTENKEVESAYLKPAGDTPFFTI